MEHRVVLDIDLINGELASDWLKDSFSAPALDLQNEATPSYGQIGQFALGNLPVDLILVTIRGLLALSPHP